MLGQLHVVIRDFVPCQWISRETSLMFGSLSNDEDHTEDDD